MQVNWFDALMYEINLAIIKSKQENDQVIKQIKDVGILVKKFSENSRDLSIFSGQKDKTFWIGAIKFCRNLIYDQMSNGKPVTFFD